MKYIVVQVHPFIMGQHIYVYEGEEVLDRIVTDFDAIPNKIIETAKKYGVKDIQLKGNKTFTEKIRENIGFSPMFNANDNFVIH